MPRRKITVLLAITALWVTGCGGGPRNAGVSISVVAGTTAERIARIESLVKTDVPSEIQDARLVEQRIGGGGIGPSDYQSYIWLKVPPESVKEWSAAWKGLPSPPIGFVAPPPEAAAATWWLSEQHYEVLEKFDTWDTFGRHGWIVIDEDGNFYAYTFTL